MGQFLAMGLVSKAYVYRKHLDRANATVADVVGEMQKSLGYDMNMYDVSENNETEELEMVEFDMKKEILQNNLCSFLKEFYPVIYPNINSIFGSDYKKIIALLEEGKFDNCMEIADGGANMAFRFDGFAEPQYIYLSKKSVLVKPVILNLYYNEGKIATENGIGDVARIFEYCVRGLFKDQPLAQSLRLYISG